MARADKPGPTDLSLLPENVADDKGWLSRQNTRSACVNERSAHLASSDASIPSHRRIAPCFAGYAEQRHLSGMPPVGRPADVGHPAQKFAGANRQCPPRLPLFALRPPALHWVGMALQKGCLIWDFERTLGYRPGQWSGTMVQVLQRFAGVEVDAESLRPFL